MRNSIYSITVEEALAAVRGSRRYQNKVAISCGAVLLSFGGTLQAVNSVAGSYTEPRWEATDSQLRVVAGLFFLGCAVGAFLCPVLADSVGRRPAMIAATYTALCASAVLSASITVTYAEVGAALSGFACAGAALAAYLSLMEVAEANYRPRCSAWLLSCALLGYFLSRILSLIVSSWRMPWTLASLSWACSLPLCQSVLESPRFLAVLRGKYGQARSVLQQISDTNRTAKFNETLEGEKVIGYHEPASSNENPESISSNPDASAKLGFVPITTGITSVSQAELTHVKRYYFWDLALLGSIRGNLICCMILWFCVNFAVASLAAESARSPGSWGLPAALGFVAIAIYSAQRIGRLHTLLISFVLLCVMSILTTVFSALSCHSQLLCTVTSVLATSAYYCAWGNSQAGVFALFLYTSELFPTAIHSLVLGTFTAICALQYAGFPAVTEVLSDVSVSPVLLAGLVLLCLCPLLCLLKETLHEDHSDYVQEEKEEMKKPADLSQVEIRPADCARAAPFTFSPMAEEK